MMQITPEQVLTELQGHVGKDSGINVRALVAAITGQQAACEPLERKVRQIMVELRMEGHHICSKPESGYFMAATADELNETCVFLHDRAMTSLTQIARMKQVGLPDLRGQLNLPSINNQE